MLSRTMHVLCRTVLIFQVIALNALSANSQALIVDCYPEGDVTESACAARGCLWVVSQVPGEPRCAFPPDYGYHAVEEVDQPDGTLLRLLRNPGQVSFYGSDVEEVHLKLHHVCGGENGLTNEGVFMTLWAELAETQNGQPHHTRSLIGQWFHLPPFTSQHRSATLNAFFDPNVPRYEVPIILDKPTRTSDTNLYRLNYSNSSVFGVTVSRSTDGKILLDTNTPGFIYSDQFLQITTKLASSYVYGFGEHLHRQYLHDLNWKTWSMFARDNPPVDGGNLYGMHPFHMTLEDDGNAHGILLLNSNAMEVTLQPFPALTYRTIGGILDFYVFLGPTPEDVVEQFSSIRGNPAMPPYWALGFQLCRWGYESAEQVRQVVDNMRLAKIPHDVQVVDIDYMDNNMDFTLGETFADLPRLADHLHDYNQKLIIILDPAIASRPGKPYPPLESGLLDDIFIKHQNGDILEGRVWPGETYFPDFSHPKAESYWRGQMSSFYADYNVTFDGIWIDMNEPSSFISGSTSGCENNTFNFPPYLPGIVRGEIEDKLYGRTVCMDASQYAGIHYNIHGLYGYHMAQCTNSVLKSMFPGIRPFVLTRSQYVGSGRYTSHWSGDNVSSWSSMKASIPASLEYNLFGIVHNGADICGFMADTNEELCIRWMQLGAFYTFSRNHNSRGNIPQDPPSLGDRVVNASILALTERYRLLPYLYTLMYEAEKSGATVARPLLHEFPLDRNTYNISYQFLWGTGLLVSPVVEEGTDLVAAYFPGPAKWYNYYTGLELNEVGSTVTLDAPLDGPINLHVRGGVIIPTQEPALTTFESRLNAAGAIVALNENRFAKGSLFWDDGITLGTGLSGQYDYYDFVWEQNNLDISLRNDGYSGPDLIFDNVIIYGLQEQPDEITINCKVVSKDRMDYNSDNKVLKMTGLGLKLKKII